jgi:hypothetical protein
MKQRRRWVLVCGGRTHTFICFTPGGMLGRETGLFIRDRGFGFIGKRGK